MAEMGTSAVWHDVDKSWEMRDLPLPELEADAIQIRVRATSVCGSDLHIWRGDGIPKDAPPRDPFVFGHEMMGEVAAMGNKITTDSLRRPLKEVTESPTRISFRALVATTASEVNSEPASSEWVASHSRSGRSATGVSLSITICEVRTTCLSSPIRSATPRQHRSTVHSRRFTKPCTSAVFDSATMSWFRVLAVLA